MSQLSEALKGAVTFEEAMRAVKESGITVPTSRIKELREERLRQSGGVTRFVLGRDYMAARVDLRDRGLVSGFAAGGLDRT